MIHLSHLLFVQCEQVKLLPKKKIKTKASRSVEAVGTARGGVEKAVKHDMNFCNFFNLIRFTISNEA